MAATAGPADRAAPTGEAQRRCREGAAARYGHAPMSPLGPRATGPKPSASPHRPRAEPRGPPGGAALGRVKTERLRCQVDLGSHPERASLAPQGAGRVRGVEPLASGGPTPDLGLPWYRSQRALPPIPCLWAPVHRIGWTLTRPPYRDTIPRRTGWSVGQRLSAPALYPSWGTTRDKTLFVGVR